MVVVAAQHQQRSRELLAQGTGNVHQVAIVKSHSHRVPGGCAQAGSGGVARGNQQHTSTGWITAPVPQARLAPALQKQFVCAIGRAHRGNALHVPQLAARITHRHQNKATRSKAHAIGLHALAQQIPAFARLAGTVPQRRRFNGCAGMGSVLPGLLSLLACYPLTFTLRQHGGIRWRCRLIGRRQHKAALLGQVQQRANGHTSTRLDAAPGAARGSRVVPVCRGAPCLEQVTPGVVGKLAFDGHTHPRPFVALQVGRDVGQGGTDQVGGNRT